MVKRNRRTGFYRVRRPEFSKLPLGIARTGHSSIKRIDRHTPEKKLILVARATGYVGGRLVPRLLQAGYRVRCLRRRRANMQHEPWLPLVECVEGDVLRPETLRPAMEGVAAVYYLVHSMGSWRDFA